MSQWYEIAYCANCDTDTTHRVAFNTRSDPPMKYFICEECNTEFAEQMYPVYS